MKILVVATKPPWPPHDGGRLVLWLTLQALAAAGHALHLIAPVDADAADPAALDHLRTVCTPQLIPLRPHSWAAAAWRAAREGSALSLARHRHAAVTAALASRLADWRPDIVHAEQLQALANCDAAFRTGTPVVLRMQNVESSLWRQLGRARPLLAFEARRLRAAEAQLLRRVAATVTLTEDDAAALRVIAPQAAVKIAVAAPPFPQQLPAGPRVAGEPALVLAGSAGWWPNRQGLDWFLARVAPRLRGNTGLRLHVFGTGSPVSRDVVAHAAPTDSATAFPDGAIAAVPLLTGSGIRMRILEAWARGLPVVATRVAAAGLAVESGRELLIADSADAFARAVQCLQADVALRAQLIANGRAYLRRWHEPAACAAALAAQYRAALT
ncbi:MAG: glycosyltransferase [Rhodanobacteraceae bacterium]|nr:glycosyltransferase [Rhodanobacteraceae bacterium]